MTLGLALGSFRLWGPTHEARLVRRSLGEGGSAEPYQRRQAYDAEGLALIFSSATLRESVLR